MHTARVSTSSLFSRGRLLGHGFVLPAVPRVSCGSRLEEEMDLIGIFKQRCKQVGDREAALMCDAARQALSAFACVCLLLCVVSSRAGAIATVGDPARSGPSGLPDSRLYEQVTPPFKNGNYFDAQLHLTYGLASADGNAVVYPMSGAVGEASSGMVTEFASKRTTAHGWQTVSTTPRATEAITLFSAPWAMVPSADFTRFLFASQTSFVKGDSSGVNIFLSEGPFAEPAWLGRPLVATPIPSIGSVSVFGYMVAGQSPDLGTVYFAYRGTLVAEDASREQHVAPRKGNRSDDPWGFYEWHAGQLVSGGELPGGGFNPFGAVPAAIAGESDFERGQQDTQAETIDNEVSEDGSRAYFVSPDPDASAVSDTFWCETEPPCSAEPPELYLREPGPGESKASVLVSASELSGHEGEAAPDGVVNMPNATTQIGGGGTTGTDIYASPDGSQAFFASKDRLTTAAPANSEIKIYDYAVPSGSLTYLPGVTAPIAQVSSDGSEALFESATSSPRQLELWHEGSGGGSVEPIAELGESQVNVNGAHVSEDGSVVVFRTNAPIPGGFNNTGGFNQIYRYDVPSDTLNCVSCPPKGVTPSGSARNSYDNSQEGTFNGSNEDPLTTIEARGMSADGSRVFFDTPDALVPQDTNRLRDVYEWEQGVVYLISSGASTEETFYLDNGADGGDVFFATDSGLVAADTDEAYDVYDARIPRPGDNLSAGAVPCKGAVCQGPPSVPQLLGAPASETFTGAGNVTSQRQATHKAKPKKKAKPKNKTRSRKKARVKRKGKKPLPAHRPKHATHVKGRGK
jgi:hypothetical protein